jgi:hypothetical protein
MGGWNHPSPAQLLQLLGHRSGRGIDVVVGPSSNAKSLALSARHGHGAETHLRRELHAQMAQPAQPEYGHRVTDQGSLMPQIDSGDLGQIDVHMQDVAIVVCGMPPGVAEHVTHQPILDQNVGNEMLNCVAVSDV